MLAQAADCDPCPAGGIAGFLVFCVFLVLCVAVFAYVQPRISRRLAYRRYLRRGGELHYKAWDKAGGQ